jgi:hypothetical protein
MRRASERSLSAAHKFDFFPLQLFLRLVLRDKRAALRLWQITSHRVCVCVCELKGKNQERKKENCQSIPEMTFRSFAFVAVRYCEQKERE